jgi:anti-sigma B factor antagonist
MSHNQLSPRNEDIEVIEDRGIVTLSFLRDVELELHGAPVFKRAMVYTIEEKEDMSAMIVDLERVSFIDSTALGVMVGAVKRLRPAGIPFVVDMTSNNSRGIRTVFNYTGLDRLLNVVYDRAFYEAGDIS